MVPELGHDVIRRAGRQLEGRPHRKVKERVSPVVSQKRGKAAGQEQGARLLLLLLLRRVHGAEQTVAGHSSRYRRDEEMRC